MGAADILAQVTASGFRLRANGDMVQIAPKDRLTDDIRELIRAHKPAVLALLRSRPVNRRVVIAFHLQDSPGTAIVLGRPGEDPESVMAGLKSRYGERLTGARVKRG